MTPPQTFYVIFRADGTARINKNRPRLQRDEIAYRLKVSWPSGWASIVGDIEITLPDPVTGVDVEQVQVEPTYDEVPAPSALSSSSGLVQR